MGPTNRRNSLQPVRKCCLTGLARAGNRLDAAEGRSAATREIDTVGPVPFLSPRMGPLAAAAAVSAAIAVTVVSGCGGNSSAPATTSTPVTSTTKIAGAAVLGNQRR